MPRPQPTTRSDLWRSKAEDTQFAKPQLPAATEGCELKSSSYTTHLVRSERHVLPALSPGRAEAPPAIYAGS